MGGAVPLSGEMGAESRRLQEPRTSRVQESSERSRCSERTKSWHFAGFRSRLTQKSPLSEA